MARRKTKARRYTNEQRQEALRLVRAGKTQAAAAAKTGIPAVTIGYWSRKADGSPSAKRARGRSGTRGRSTDASRSGGIAWALDGNTLVIRIPLRNFARQVAEEALKKI